MKDRIVLGFSLFMMAASMVACGNDKKASTTETSTAAIQESPVPANEVATKGVNSTEQKLYDFSTVYMNKIEVAIAEPDDEKAIALLNSIKNEMKADADVLKPEVEGWVKSLSKEEAKAFGERMMQQPSTVKAFQMMGDPKLVSRLEKSPKFREAFEKANEGPSEIWQLGEKNTAGEE